MSMLSNILDETLSYMLHEFKCKITDFNKMGQIWIFFVFGNSDT